MLEKIKSLINKMKDHDKKLQLSSFMNTKGKIAQDFYFWQNCVLASVCFVYIIAYLGLSQEVRESEWLVLACGLFTFSLPGCVMTAFAMRTFSPVIDTSLLFTYRLFQVFSCFTQGSCVLGLILVLMYLSGWYVIFFFLSILLSFIVFGFAGAWLRSIYTNESKKEFESK